MLGILVFLTVALIVARCTPVPLGRGRKLGVGTVPRFLLAAVFVPALATPVAMGAVATSDLLTRRRRGLRPRTIATDALRCGAVCLLGSFTAHLSIPGDLDRGFALTLALIVMWAADMLTTPILLGPILHQPAATIIRRCVQDAGALEGMQYLFGCMLALSLRTGWLMFPATVLSLGFFYLMLHGMLSQSHERTHQTPAPLRLVGVRTTTAPATDELSMAGHDTDQYQGNDATAGELTLGPTSQPDPASAL
jgi:hypothetical protein